jgi:hypothetical protein
MEFLLGPLGLTVQSQADEYSRRLTDDRTGIKTWNMGDMLRDVLTPGTREDLEKAARDLSEKRINQSTSTDRELIRQTLGNTSMNVSEDALKIGQGETLDRYKARLGGLTTTGTANVNNTGIEGYDPTKVVDGMTATGVAQLGTAQGKTNRETKETKVQNEIERKEGRADDLLMMQMLQNNRQSDRQFQLQQAQQDYQNRALDLKESRLDRKDRQAAIQAMMAGLSQLGASIAI